MKPISSRRVAVPLAAAPGNAGIRARYPIDLAKWIWAPEAPVASGKDVQVLRFSLPFELELPTTIMFDVTADQRFLLACDGEEVGRGPDRADLTGWSFHRMALQLAAGAHTLTATVWWLAEKLRPVAQVTARPGFALVGLGEADAWLSTGKAPWAVQEWRGWSSLPKNPDLQYHVIGCGFRFDGAAGLSDVLVPEVVASGTDGRYGVGSTPWRCEPSPLPEQISGRHGGGTIYPEALAKRFAPLTCGESVSLAAGEDVEVFWDLGDYVCGYPALRLSGGSGSVVQVEWAESLYDEANPHAHLAKGNRSAFTGKSWLGFGDAFYHPGGEADYESLWWRSGRWLRIQVQGGSEPLEIQDARPRLTGYPYTRKWAFAADDAFDDLLTLCENGLRHCVHETFVDCPYYEQMQYLGDTRVQARVWLAAAGDPRPVRRALEIFERSRGTNGFHAERAPSSPVQMSGTYSLVQPLLLRDYAWWTRDVETVQRMLPGTRSALEHALACVDARGLPVALPGWLFVDWVQHAFWEGGVPGGDTGNCSAPVALHVPMALDAAAEVERAFGDVRMAARYEEISKELTRKLVDAFVSEDGSFLYDDLERQHRSEHTQALALACRWLPESLKRPLLEFLKQPPPDAALASVYFRDHVHQALVEAGEGDTLVARFSFWRDLVGQGFCTTVEAPEPSRSDCHGWGAHPLYHCLTGLAGIRPDAPGFTRVRVAPVFGKLQEIRATVPHPDGEVRVELQRTGAELSAKIETPVAGVLVWMGMESPLTPGMNELWMPFLA